ncbi:MAG: transcriptional regulator [Nitrosopumilales archaeon CG15_BIG_FIL_POST_REV_8_21_14_020_33_23]|nr:MAG: transcriptional regulator [Nitrosopumilales archaeon CG11_big_fil_rev_8_21_14_0_20_33_24]PIW35706.1 MAG: transcriptional regulator [Nitrosopumilales archaeon CG15_BIG_FIL_POST_REV_8_21_14_020_33_23]PIY89952.1 MAG: transcriptional regulator [Nitrosopumilales archaeon CG_4_10_14_0_8_um_filter_34_8]PJB96604.1 MAG: transcriptional regulator [Nitrosopumilales archaeon CG_4_9_14_0_8_um_filter_34_10]
MDNLDIKILSRLLNNCRESDRQIGKELGISGGAIRARIKKMQETKIIEKFTIKVEPPILGLGVLYIVVSGQNIKDVLEQIRLVGEPFFVVPCVGGITICSIVIKENLQQKIALANKLMKDVRVLSIFEAENPGFNSNLTKTDLEILEYLIKEPRQKIEKIAEEMSLSTKTVTRCIDKLQENNGIQFTLIYNPTKIEGFIPHAILAWIDGSLRETLEKMNDDLSESFMQIPFIAKNQIVLFMYSHNIFEMDELTKIVRNMNGVKSADLFIPKEISLPMKWLEQAINNAKKSPTLHISYQTN